MSYLIVIVLLALAVFVEFLLIRKGMKAGRRNSQHVQGSVKTVTTKVQNRAVSRTSPVPETFSSTPTQDVDDIPEKSNEPDALPERRENIISFPEKASISRESKRDRQPQPSSRTSPQEERSMADIIKDIRGGGSQPPKEAPFSLLRSPSSPSDADVVQDGGPDAENFADVEEVEYEYIEEVIEEDEPLENVEVVESEDYVEEIGENDYEEVSEEDSTTEVTPEEQIKIGLDLVRQGQLDEGIEYIESALREVPEKADAHFNLGIAYTLKEDMSQAIRSYQRAIEIDQHYGKAFYNLGTLYLKQGDIQEAILKLEQAAKLLLDPMKALWNLYEAYRSDGLFTKALANLQRLIELEPDDASLYNHLGICYVKLGDYAKAIGAWKRSIKLGASSQLIHYNLGKTYELYGEFSNARKHYNMFIDLAADNDEWQGLVMEVQDRLANLQA